MATKTKYTCLGWQFCEVNLLDGNFANPIVCNGKYPIFSSPTRVRAILGRNKADDWAGRNSKVTKNFVSLLLGIDRSRRY